MLLNKMTRKQNHPLKPTVSPLEEKMRDNRLHGLDTFEGGRYMHR